MITYTYAKPQFTTMSEGSGWFDSGGGDSGSASAAPGAGASPIGQTAVVTGPETITHAGSGLVFVNTYGSGVSATFRTEIFAAENYLQSHFTNACTINCSFDLQQLNPSFSGQNSFSPITVSYASLRAALSSHATSPDDVAAVNALANLPDPSGGQGFEVPIGEARILGLANAGSGIDDAVVLNNLYWTAQALQNSPGDAIAVIEHEVSEGAMGRIGGLGLAASWAPMDLFRFTAAGQRDFTGGQDGLATYFSPDGNNVATGLQFHNSINSQGTPDGFDLSDWDQVGADSNARDPFGPGGPGTGDPGTLSSTDLRIMDVLGWTRTPAITAAVAHDFNGDAVSDILLYNTSSATVGEWLMQNGQLSVAQSIGNLGVGSGWSVVGSGDFNGDRTTDIMLYYAPGAAVGEWLMQNGQITQAKSIGSLGVNSGWSAIGTGDFNGDGTSDVLLYYAPSATVGEWLMQNGQITQAKSIGSLGVNSGWSVIGTGDFNGNGTTDILLYHANTGTVGEWLMQNGQLTSAQTVGSLGVGTGWSVIGTGDFNGDGTTDILLYNAPSNTISAWLMQNGHIALAQTISSLPAGWSFAGTGDFNGDGTTDILLQNGSGGVSEWLMQGGNISSAQTIGSIGSGSNWQIKQV